MSKYSGLFLSFLLIFICLWINICRYPQAWKMANGGDASAPGAENEAVESDNVLETNFKPYTEVRSIAETNAAEEGSWPKPVIITSKSSSGEENADQKESPAENAGSAEDSSFQTVSMTSAPEEQKEGNPSEEAAAPKDEDVPAEGLPAEGTPKDGDAPSEEESSKDGNLQKEENPAKEGDILKEKSEEEKGSNSEEKKPEEKQEKEEEDSPQVHSSYMAAEFPEGKSPLNSDSPSYEVK